MITVEQLSKSYGATKAVDNVSFDVPRGQLFGLLGPNGAGKTTTLHMIMGLVRPDGGSIRIADGLDPCQASARRTLGIVPQSLSLYEELTAKENIRFFGSLYGVTGHELNDRVAWGLALAGLEDRRNHRVSTFSGGMKRRLNLAAALVHRPAVVLMDEPTVGVDPQSRNHIFDTIQQLSRDGLTIIYTTHYMEEAQRLCDRVAIMDRGRIMALDSVSGLLRAHGGRAVVSGELVREPPPRTTLPGQRVGTTLRFESDRPLAELNQLAAAGIEFASVQIAQSDLESVFLALTGRALRDE